MNNSRVNISEKKWQRLGLNQRPRAYEFLDQLQLLNSLSVTEISLLSKFSKSYIFQVKRGIRPPSKKLLKILDEYQVSTKTEIDYYNLFMLSRQSMQVSSGTEQFYRTKVGRFVREVNVDKASRQDIETFLLQFGNPGNRHAYYRAVKTFYNWREETFDLPSPMDKIKAPRLCKLILPSLTREQVDYLLNIAVTIRDKAIIAMFTESGLRLSELVNIRPTDIDWKNGTIKVLGKGRKEALAPLGKLTRKYLEELIKPNDIKELKDGSKGDLSTENPGETSDDISRINIWHLNQWGVTSMLRRLEKKSGYPCNPHVFRRTFACLLRKSGLDVMTIKDLGRWESLEMVQHYTRSVTFQDSLKFYQSVLA
jgi:integrase